MNKLAKCDAFELLYKLTKTSIIEQKIRTRKRKEKRKARKKNKGASDKTDYKHVHWLYKHTACNVSHITFLKKKD